MQARTPGPTPLLPVLPVITALVLALLACGCGSRGTVPPPPSPVVTIAFGESLLVGTGPMWQHEDPTRQVQSAYPVVSTHHAPPRLIGAGGKTYSMKHGLTDLTLDLPGGPLRVCAIRLKDREYHRANPAELRRSEARKWASHLKPVAKSGLDFVLFVDAYAEEDSAPMQALIDALPVEILPAADPGGGHWTHRVPKEDSQHRWRFALVNPGAAKRIADSRLNEDRALVLEMRP